MAGTLNVTTEFRSFSDMSCMSKMQVEGAKKQPKYCEKCMSGAARSSLAFLRKRAGNKVTLAEDGLCSKCVEPGPVYDLPFLLMMNWYGLLNGGNISRLVENCQSAVFFDRAVEYLGMRETS